MILSKLPKWNKLTKKEKKRLEKVYKVRVEDDYDVDGSKVIGKRELKKGVKNG